jgi:hypothetical protein
MGRVDRETFNPAKQCDAARRCVCPWLAAVATAAVAAAAAAVQASWRRWLPSTPPRFPPTSPRYPRLTPPSSSKSCSPKWWCVPAALAARSRAALPTPVGRVRVVHEEGLEAGVAA